MIRDSSNKGYQGIGGELHEKLVMLAFVAFLGLTAAREIGRDPLPKTLEIKVENSIVEKTNELGNCVEDFRLKNYLESILGTPETSEDNVPFYLRK